MLKKELFNETPVKQAIIKLIVPTIISQIVMVVYQISDVFFVGLSNSDEMLTATTICMPVFMILNAIANLFGIGSCTSISRSLGRKKEERARRTAAFAFWSSIFVGMIYLLILFLFLDPIINLVGGRNELVHVYAKEYIIRTVIIGGLFAIVSNLFSAQLRSEGRNTHASRGLILGGVINIILDPIFMFVLLPRGNEVIGAALATMFSNIISLLYYVILLTTRYKNGKTIINFQFNKTIIGDHIPSSVISSGMPAFIMTLFENISYAILDALMSTYGVIAQASLGVAKKLNMLAHSCVRGVSQGAMPLLSYNYATKNDKRFKEAIKVTMTISVLIASLCTFVSLLFAKPLISIFIHTNDDTLIFGIRFLRILCLGAPFSAGIYTFISLFESIGKGKVAFVLAILRKGVIDIPLMYILNELLLKYGIVMATPIADLIGCFASCIIFLRFISIYNEEIV